MRTELYQWMKSLAFFHVLTTALLHILPDKRYEQYIRLFMGLGANFSTDGSATIGKSLSVGGNSTVNGTLMFYDLENQAKTSGKVKRQPIASVSADDSQVA